MPGRIAASLADHTPEVRAAANDGHHLVIGPGDRLTNGWVADGLELPDLAEIRRYRLARIRQQLQSMDYGGVVLMDPMSIRYATDTTNMQIWVMHNAARYCYVSARDDGPVILWDYSNCEFLAGHNDQITEVRPAIATIFFTSGSRYKEHSAKWAAEMIDVIAADAGAKARIAIDQCHLIGYQVLQAAGIELGSGQEVMELARAIKSPDEIRAMRCAAHACQATMAEMRTALQPGMTERDVWAMLHAGNIRRGGEWIETQIISSGPRTNPWFQECSSRVIEPGDLVAYDTDLVGAYGMMIDISRSWVAGGGKPNAHQRNLHSMAVEQLARNAELLTPGRTFRELTFDSWKPPTEDYRHYSVQYHGVGQCDEFPSIYFAENWEAVGYDGVVEPGMVFTAESFIGPRAGGEGMKLEDQYLVTESGPELLTDFPLDL